MTIAPARPTGQSVGTAWVDDWAPLGSCSKTDPDALFVQGAAQQTAKVWGGMTERERRALLKRRPNISSWASLFAQARGQSPAEAESA